MNVETANCRIEFAREQSVNRRTSDAAPFPRVLVAGKLSASACPGGGEIQMHSTARHLRANGTNVELWRPWEHRLEDFDILHCFGSEPEFLPLFRSLPRRIKRVVSPIAWFDAASRLRESGAWHARIMKSAKLLALTAAPRFPNWRREFYHSADLLLPNSHAEAEQLTRYFQVPAEKIRVIPNGADPSAVQGGDDQFVRKFGLSDYVLCAGRIEPRKNQLNLIRALRGTCVPLVIMGNCVPGFEWYESRCRRAADENVHFVGHLPHGSGLWKSALASCRCLALVSHFETPGLIALEAAMLGVPLVLTVKGSTREYFGNHARYVRPQCVQEIRAAVLEARRQEMCPSLAEHVHSRFTWQQVAQHTQSAYGLLV